MEVFNNSIPTGHELGYRFCHGGIKDLINQIKIHGTIMFDSPELSEIKISLFSDIQDLSTGFGYAYFLYSIGLSTGFGRCAALPKLLYKS